MIVYTLDKELYSWAIIRLSHYLASNEDKVGLRELKNFQVESKHCCQEADYLQPRQPLSVLHFTLLALHPWPLNLGFACSPLKIIEAEKFAGKHEVTFLVQMSCFSPRSLVLLSNLKHIFRMLQICVENTHSYIITSEKHSLRPSEHLLLVLLVVHSFDHLADGFLGQLIDFSIPPSIIAQSPTELRFRVTTYPSLLACSWTCLTSNWSDIC